MLTIGVYHHTCDSAALLPLRRYAALVAMVNRRAYQNRVRPQIPREHESGKPAQRNRRPLIEPAFEGHQPREVDHHCRLRQVVEDDREEPEDRVVVPKLCRRPDPARPDHVHDLHQDQVDEPELFTEPGTPRFDLGDALYRQLAGQGLKTSLLTNSRHC